MKITAIIFCLFSIITLLIVIIFFLGEFEKIGLKKFIIGQYDRNYITSNVRKFFYFIFFVLVYFIIITHLDICSDFLRINK
jgi:hypothetical protein